MIALEKLLESATTIGAAALNPTDNGKAEAEARKLNAALDKQRAASEQKSSQLTKWLLIGGGVLVAAVLAFALLGKRK